MDKFVVFSLVFALSSLCYQSAFSLLPSLEGERVIALRSASEDILLENASVQKFFRSLDGDEQRLFNAVLQSNYAAGYYSELLKFSDADHYADLEKALEQAEERLRMLKNDRIYDAILAQANRDVIRFTVGRRDAGIVRGYSAGQRKWVYATRSDLAVQLSIDQNHYWGALFFGEVYTPLIKGARHSLRAVEVFPLSAHEMTLKSAPSPELQKSRRFGFDLSRVDTVKVFFVSLLSLLAIVIGALFIGIHRFSHIPVFRKTRLLFGY